MTTKISQTISGCFVVQQEDKKPLPIYHLAERPTELSGKTYKVKTPQSDHALYITINDENGAPFEIFLNSKEMQHYQWIVALTRVMSAVFRKGGDCTFLVDELKNTHDPSGGFFSRGRYVPSLVAEIGYVLEEHLMGLGLLVKDESLKVSVQMMMKEKLESKSDNYPEHASICSKCGAKAVIKMDGCATCLECGQSKCS